MKTLNFENIGERFLNIIHSKEWQELQEKFNHCDDIYILGHGGNMAVADHAAVDITRLSNGSKNAICPGSAVVYTSFINDTDFEQWMVNWLSCRTATRTKRQMKKSLVLGISSSGRSTDVLKALQWSSERDMKVAIISSKDIPVEVPSLTKVLLGADYYHTAEVLTLLLSYQLTHGSGNVCPPIDKNTVAELSETNWKGGKIRKYSYPDEKVNIAVDFDGVIHKCSKGYYDGTIYDEPVEGVRDALEKLSAEHNVIVFTCKARSDRGLVNGKTGIEMVWEWLKQHDLDKYISKVTSEKPRALVYIDDKSVEFKDWQTCLNKLQNKEILL